MKNRERKTLKGKKKEHFFRGLEARVWGDLRRKRRMVIIPKVSFNIKIMILLMILSL